MRARPQAPPTAPAPAPAGDGRLAGKRCLVTGGSRNLGRAMALAFARAGARVAFTYEVDERSADETRHLLVQAGASPLIFRGSVADAAHARQVVETLEGLWGGIDVLVNNAARTQVLPIALIEEPDWDRVMDTNVKGAYLFSRAALPSMLRAGRGHILNVGAFSVDRVMDAPVHYATSKAALLGFTRALAREVGPQGVRVNCLSPGLMTTGMSRLLAPARLAEIAAQTALGRLAAVEEVAAAAVWLTSDASLPVTAANVVIDGGL